MKEENIAYSLENTTGRDLVIGLGILIFISTILIYFISNLNITYSLISGTGLISGIVFIILIVSYIFKNGEKE